MQAALLWAAYAEALLGVPVSDAAKKFAALGERERLAWGAVALVQKFESPVPQVLKAP